MKTPLLTALCFAFADTPGESPELPATLTLIPAPDAAGFVEGVDGRRFKVDAAALVAAFSRKLPVDENHATHIAGPNGLASPAFGWVTRLFAEGGAVMGDVTWTKRGVAALNGRDYGYLSPAFSHDQSGQAVRLVSVGLTNDPNFPQLALNSAGIHSLEAEEAQPMSKAIAVALGLADTATEAECLVALNAVKAKSGVDLSQFAPRADYDLALNRASVAEAKLAEQAAATQKAAVDAAIDGALIAGKIAPTSVEYHRAMCAQPGGFERFTAYVATAPQVIDPGAAQSKKPGDESLSLNAEDKQVAAQLGLSQELYMATKKRVADDVAARSV